MQLNLVSHKEALAQGLKRFFTGRPCKRGHIAERRVCDRQCVECYRVWVTENKDKEKAIQDRYRANHKEEVYARYKAWEDANYEKRLASARDWARKNSHRWAVWNANRRAAELQATPAWADMQKILDVYREAERLSITTGILHHVDHIVPLRSDIVCGLHVHWNLRAIPASDNCSKGNRWWPES